MDSFDPYYTWLGIPPRHQPPDLYRLLGLERFEDNTEAIRDAAERQIAHVRRYQLGEHAQWSQQILNELARASATLTDAASKRRYDAELRQQLAPPVVAPPVVMPAQPPQAPPVQQAHPVQRVPAIVIRDQPDLLGRSRRRQPKHMGLVLAGAAAVAVVLVGLGYAFWPGHTSPRPVDAGDPEPPVVSSADPGQQPSEDPDQAPTTVPDAPDPSATLTDSIGQQLVLVPAGSFLMGSADGDPDADADSRPRHRVDITRPFYLGVHEVTQQQYQAIMDGYNPSEDRAAHQPVTNVNWSDAEEFCRRLSLREQALYRLPTEAEWEYACRAGTSTPWSSGANASELRRAAWYENNSQGGPRLVGQLAPNPWGLYDMHGNVAEMVQDWFSADYYGRSPAADPVNLDGKGSRVFRGGNFAATARQCRADYRGAHTASVRSAKVGFRVVRVKSD